MARESEQKLTGVEMIPSENDWQLSSNCDRLVLAPDIKIEETEEYV